LWLQESASSNQAAIMQIQAQIEQQQQAAAQQQQNMAALRAQMSDSNKASAANVSTCAELRSSLQQLQQRLEQCCKDVSRQADQMLEVTEQQQVCCATGHHSLPAPVINVTLSAPAQAGPTVATPHFTNCGSVKGQAA
jgi:chromosome segregation ATPase